MSQTELKVLKMLLSSDEPLSSKEVADKLQVAEVNECLRALSAEKCV
jgi:predicted transcriptional regulator